ncbi:MAG TPA: putative hydroxymethylpyrimidine transporter CytX [Firmicutes bacterium]|nr:putative hydroxymethylpyrimidine transporter CytX [Bacillota bacterium]
MVEIEPIPGEKRNLGPIAFFFIWAGAGISLAEVLAGGFLAPVGLIAGITANVLGHLVGNTLFSMGGVIGTDHGIPSMVSVRPSFGVRGSYLATAFNALQLVGWTAVMLVVAARSLDTISKEMLDFSNYPVWVVIIGIATTAWAWVGREGWKWLQSVVSALLLVICGYIGYIILSTVGLRGLLTVPRTGTMSFGLACDLVIAMPLSWLPLVADYSRFGRSTRGAFCGTWTGYFVSSSLMYTLGLAAALATGKADIIATLTTLGMGAAALFVVAFSTLTTAFLDVYSTAVSIQNLLPKLRERHLILAAGALGTLVALFFPIERYENFLLFIGGVFVPLFGIVLADYFVLRRRKLATQDLFKRGGAYWYTSGVNPAAIVAWIIGVLIYYVCTRTGFWLGASIPSFMTASGLYLAEMALAAAGESRRTKGVDAR